MWKGEQGCNAASGSEPHGGETAVEMQVTHPLEQPLPDGTPAGMGVSTTADPLDDRDELEACNEEAQKE